MVLQMFIGDTLLDSSILSLTQMNDNTERERYIEHMINELLEKWSDVINQQNSKVEFFIDGYMFLEQ
jgi:hypothetical protein